MDADLRHPDEIARLFAKQRGSGDEIVVGETIEVWAHHTLEDPAIPLHEKGVDPKDVRFRQQRLKRDFTKLAERCNELNAELPEDERFEPDLVPAKKYGVACLPGCADDPANTLEFFETDWNTFKVVDQVVKRRENLALRHAHSHVNPKKNLLPQSMSLHFLVRFLDGDVLAMLRTSKHFHEGRWSFSAEEQIKEEDWQVTGVEAAEFLFRRAFIEEIFGRKSVDPKVVNGVWDDYCREIVASARFWSVILEERMGCFASFGMFQLDIDRDQLVDIHERGKREGHLRDNEGPLYIVSERNIDELLRNGVCEGRLLHGNDPISIFSEQLHPTSRYRLWRLYCALPPERRWRPPEKIDVAIPAPARRALTTNKEQQRVEAALGPEAEKILIIARDEALSLEDKMKAIGRMDSAWKGKLSPAWGDLLGVTPNRVRQLVTWKEWGEHRPRRGKQKVS